MAKEKKGPKEAKSLNIAVQKPRLRKATRVQKKKQKKKEALKQSKIPSSFRLTAQVFKTLRKFWLPLGGIILVYLILNFVFAGGFTTLRNNVSDLRSTLEDSGNRLSDVLAGFSNLVGTAGYTSSATSSLLQGLLIVLTSLVIIWALRQLLAGQSIKVKHAYYNSTGPLVPFLLVVAWIFIQLLPLTLGVPLVSLGFETLFGGGAGPTIGFLLIFGLLALWSFYMVSSSIFALYIVTLPDMHPRMALRSAKNLVRFRRFAIIRKVAYLPVFIVLAMGILVIPLLAWLPVLVAPVMYLLGAASILFVHTYLYSLYRSLLE